MKQRTLLLLTIITVVVAVAAIISSHSRAPQSSIDKTLLFPELAGHINDINEIVITGQGKTLNLVKKNDAWVIEQTGGYSAVFTKIKPVIIGISELEVIAKKTSNPELYSRLGVEDPDGERATSHLLTLKSESGDLASLIIGKRQKSSGTGNSGLYVRLPDEKQSLLVEGSIEVSADVTDWIERDLFSIGPERIKSVRINYPDSSQLTLSRQNDVETFTIEDIPEGKEPQTEVVLKRMQTLLENFFVDNIKSKDSVQFPEDKVVTTVRTFDGLVVTITSASINNENLSHITFDFDESAVKKPADPDTADKPDVKKEAMTLNEKYSPWVFVVPDFKYELLVKEKDKLIKDKKAESPKKTKS